MQIYLVGGAVRDTLLNYPHSEKDWVVVGATAADMLTAGFKSVGKDFPVFLHPDTQEEYALARQERKTAPGYSGFEFNTEKSVTLEEDLQRRDLTINAMAMDNRGNVIDPYGGQQDIERKLLRHVSPAFSEDPVRVLRLARFAARYAHLGFTIATETLDKVRTMVTNGEVDHLVAERVWKELEKALAERDPQVFIDVLRQTGALARIMPEIDQLFGVPQPEKHHPEIDTGVHSLLSLKRASVLSDDLTVRFASLVHDLGKARTPIEELPHHYGHESITPDLIDQLCERLNAPNGFRDLARCVGKYHTHCHRAMELTPKTLLKTFEALDVLRRPERMRQFTLACQADAQGRAGLDESPYPQADYLIKASMAFSGVAPKSIAHLGLKGAAFGEALRKERLTALQDFVAGHKTK